MSQIGASRMAVAQLGGRRRRSIASTHYIAHSLQLPSLAAFSQPRRLSGCALAPLAVCKFAWALGGVDSLDQFVPALPCDCCCKD